MEGILIVGYGVSAPNEQMIQREIKVKTPPMNDKKKNLENVVIADAGLLPKERLWDVLKDYPQKLVGELR